jgi:hypothetical protein
MTPRQDPLVRSHQLRPAIQVGTAVSVNSFTVDSYSVEQRAEAKSILTFAAAKSGRGSTKRRRAGGSSDLFELGVLARPPHPHMEKTLIKIKKNKYRDHLDIDPSFYADE